MNYIRELCIYTTSNTDPIFYRHIVLILIHSHSCIIAVIAGPEFTVESTIISDIH